MACLVLAYFDLPFRENGNCWLQHVYWQVSWSLYSSSFNHRGHLFFTFWSMKGYFYFKTWSHEEYKFLNLSAILYALFSLSSKVMFSRTNSAKKGMCWWKNGPVQRVGGCSLCPILYGSAPLSPVDPQRLYKPLIKTPNAFTKPDNLNCYTWGVMYDMCILPVLERQSHNILLVFHYYYIVSANQSQFAYLNMHIIIC